MTLTKADLVQKVYKSHNNLTKAQATHAVEALLSTMKNCLAGGEEIRRPAQSLSLNQDGWSLLNLQEYCAQKLMISAPYKSK